MGQSRCDDGFWLLLVLLVLLLYVHFDKVPEIYKNKLGVSLLYFVRGKNRGKMSITQCLLYFIVLIVSVCQVQVCVPAVHLGPKARYVILRS